MATNKSSTHHCYQIAPPLNASKFVSKSTESLTNIDLNTENQKQSVKASKMKKSQTVFNGFETKGRQSPPQQQPALSSTSVLRRRFSLFRIKRTSQQPQPTLITNPSSANSNVQALQQIIDQLRCDLRIKTDELESMREHIEKKRSSIAVPTNESIEQAMQLQTMLNARLEEMLIENDLLKKSIQELEFYAQQQKCK